MRSVMNGFVNHLNNKTTQFYNQYSTTFPHLLPHDPIEWVEVPITGFDAKKAISATMPIKHLIFMDNNGQVAIYKLPTPKEILTMTQADVALQQFIQNKLPLKQQVFSRSLTLPPTRPKTPEEALSYPDTLALLQGPLSLQLPNGQTKTLSLQNRTYGNGWSDIHTLLYYCPFDFQRYINEGIWTPHVLFELQRPNMPSIWKNSKTAAAT